MISSKNFKRSEILRINIKTDFSFWVIKPYKESMHYIIDGESYSPTSSRFLCFALIIVKHSDKNDIKFKVSQELSEFVEKEEKKNDKINNSRK